MCCCGRLLLVVNKGPEMQNLQENSSANQVLIVIEPICTKLVSCPIRQRKISRQDSRWHWVLIPGNFCGSVESSFSTGKRKISKQNPGQAPKNFSGRTFLTDVPISLFFPSAFNCVLCLLNCVLRVTTFTLDGQRIAKSKKPVTKLWHYGYNLQQKTQLYTMSTGVIIIIKAEVSLSRMGWGWRINHETTSWCIKSV